MKQKIAKMIWYLEIPFQVLFKKKPNKREVLSKKTISSNSKERDITPIFQETKEEKTRQTEKEDIVLFTVLEKETLEEEAVRKQENLRRQEKTAKQEESKPFENVSVSQKEATDTNEEDRKLPPRPIDTIVLLETELEKEKREEKARISSYQKEPCEEQLPIQIAKEETTLKDEEITKIESNALEKKLESGMEEILKNRYQALDRLAASYQKVENALEKTDEAKEVAALLEEVKKTLSKLEALQKDVESLGEKGDLKAATGMESILYKEIEKLNVYSNAMLISFVLNHEKYNEMVTKLSQIEEKREGLEQKLEEKLEFLEKRDEKFQELASRTDLSMQFENNLYKSCLEMDVVALDLERKANAKITSFEKVTYQLDFSTKAATLFLAYMALSKQKKGPCSIGMSLLAGFLAMRAIKGILHKEKTIDLVQSYTDYSHEIESALSSVTDLKDLLKKGIRDIEAIEKQFETEFSTYLSTNKQYKKLYDSILLIKENLKEKEVQFLEQENRLHESMKLTKEKVYQLTQ